MDWTGLLEKAVWVDWKNESEDTLTALRGTYGAVCPALEQPVFDTLAENYAAEGTLDCLRALGQELTCFGWSLWYMEENADAYPLVMLPLEEAQAFQSWCRGRKREHQLRQSRRKVGQSARQLDLGQRLPCQRYLLPTELGIWGGPVGDSLWLGNLPGEEPQGTRLHLEVWPPRMESLPCAVTNAVQGDGHLAAILTRYQGLGRGPEEGFPRLWVGNSLDELAGDRAPEGLPLEREWNEIFWFHGDLFLADRSHVARIQRAAEGGALRMELQVQEKKLTFPAFFVLKDTLYLHLQGNLYRWREGGLLRRAGFSRLSWPVPGEKAQGFLPVGEREMAFLSRPLSMSREAAVDWAFTVLDMESGRRRQVPCRCGELRLWQGRVCVLPHGTGRGEPILQCFDLTTGVCRTLLRGALGKSEIYDLFSLKDGRTVLWGEGLYFTDTEGLWSFMEETRTGGKDSDEGKAKGIH